MAVKRRPPKKDVMGDYALHDGDAFEFTYTIKNNAAPTVTYGGVSVPMSIGSIQGNTTWAPFPPKDYSQMSEEFMDAFAAGIVARHALANRKK